MFCGLDIIQVTAHNPNLSTLYLTSTRLKSIWAPLKTEFGERLIKNKNLEKEQSKRIWKKQWQKNEKHYGR